MRIDANDPARTDLLARDLREAGCVSVRVGETALAVAYPAALDEREEAIELTFFLRAWAAADRESSH